MALLGYASMDIETVCKRLTMSWFRTIRRYGPCQENWDAELLKSWYDSYVDQQVGSQDPRLPKWFNIVREINDRLIHQLGTCNWEADQASREAFCDWLDGKSREIRCRWVRSQVRAMTSLIQDRN